MRLKVAEQKGLDRNHVFLNTLVIQPDGSTKLTTENSPYVTALKAERVLGVGDLALVMTILNSQSGEVNPNFVLKLLNPAGLQATGHGMLQSVNLITEEAKLLNSCQHPHIARFERLVGLALTPELVLPGIVRENLPLSLKDVLAKNGGRLDQAEILRLIRGVVAGMSYLEREKNLLYTDLSLDNIRFRRVEAEQPVIADLNYTYPLDTELGNQGYDEDFIPPEFVPMNSPRLAKPKVQVWQLASLIQQLAGGSAFSMEYLALSPEIKVPPGVEGLSENAIKVVKNGLLKDPALRSFENPRAFLDALERA